MKWTRSRITGAVALGTASALVLAACGNGDDPAEPTTDPTDAPTTPAEPVNLTLGYFENFGFEIVADEYMELNPHVTLESAIAEWSAHHENLQQQIIAGSGAPNIAAVDGDFMTGFVAQAENFVNLIDLGGGQYQDRYLDWKWAQAANADGSYVIGFGSDVGGLALCYRQDLFEEAGLTHDRDELAAEIGGSWADFFEFGEAYVEATDRKFIDNATQILNPALTQLGVGYYNRNNELDLEAAKPAFDIAVEAIDRGLSANIGVWGPEWNAGFANGDFAVLACPGWMRGVVQGNVGEDFDGQWDVTDIPGPGGNWGGSFYVLPNQYGPNETQEAYNFIEWIIQPEQQMKIFEALGNLPSQTALLDELAQSDDVTPLGEFFNGAPESIFVQSVLDIPGAIYYAPKHNQVRTALENVLGDIQNGEIAIADAWAAAVEAAEAADAA